MLQSKPSFLDEVKTSVLSLHGTDQNIHRCIQQIHQLNIRNYRYRNPPHHHFANHISVLTNLIKHLHNSKKLDPPTCRVMCALIHGISVLLLHPKCPLNIVNQRLDQKPIWYILLDCIDRIYEIVDVKLIDYLFELLVAIVQNQSSVDGDVQCVELVIEWLLDDVSPESLAALAKCAKGCKISRTVISAKQRLSPLVQIVVDEMKKPVEKAMLPDMHSIHTVLSICVAEQIGYPPPQPLTPNLVVGLFKICC